MARFVIDPPTFVHLVSAGVPASIGDAEYLAVTRLQADLFVTVDPAARTRAEGIVRVGTVDQLGVA
jgi:hypothetical protein